MNKDTVIELARDCPYTSDELRGAYYEGFLKGAAAERAKCAHLVASQNRGNGVISEETRQMLKWCAAAIRNRDNKVPFNPPTRSSS